MPPVSENGSVSNRPAPGRGQAAGRPSRPAPKRKKNPIPYWQRLANTNPAAAARRDPGELGLRRRGTAALKRLGFRQSAGRRLATARKRAPHARIGPNGQILVPFGYHNGKPVDWAPYSEVMGSAPRRGRVGPRFPHPAPRQPNMPTAHVPGHMLAGGHALDPGAVGMDETPAPINPGFANQNNVIPTRPGAGIRGQRPPAYVFNPETAANSVEWSDDPDELRRRIVMMLSGEEMQGWQGQYNPTIEIIRSILAGRRGGV